MMKMQRMTVTSLLLLGSSCGGVQQVEVRPAGSVLNAAKPVSSRLAEAKGHFALGNVALALEQFRVAAREDSRSVDALTGIADCYTAMGRPELAQRQYELALAISPADPALLAGLASSLDAQGMKEKAALVRLEMGMRAAAELALNEPVRLPAVALPTSGVTPAPSIVLPVEMADNQRPPTKRPPTPSAVAPAVGPTVTVTLPAPAHMRGAAALGNDIGQSVTVTLAPARPAPAAAKPAPATKLTELPRHGQSTPRPSSGPRLERMSLTEVALTTVGAPSWVKLEMAAPRKTRVAPVQFARRELRILNGARVQGLAASTRAYLVARGWRSIQISDAQTRREMSTLYVPSDHARIGSKLAAQFRFPVRIQPSSRDLVLILGTNAAMLRGRRNG